MKLYEQGKQEFETSPSYRMHETIMSSMKNFDNEYFKQTDEVEKNKIEQEIESRQFKITNGNTLNSKYVDRYMDG